VPELRRAIADGFTERGLPTTAGQIVVTDDARSAIANALRRLVGSFWG
jgi:DNA-binding transcriptional MocR family regulator